MIVALVSGLECDPGLLKQVILNNAAVDLVGLVEANLDELSESAGVVVADSLGIPCVAHK